MAWEENSRICLNMQLIAILSRIGVKSNTFYLNRGEKVLKSYIYTDIYDKSQPKSIVWVIKNEGVSKRKHCVMTHPLMYKNSVNNITERQ